VFFSLFFNLNYKRHHASINIFLTLTTIVVNFALAYYYNRLIGLSNQFGILQWLPNVIMVICLSRFTLLDLIGAYLVHLVEQNQILVALSFNPPYRCLG
jgi:hypothetical protein